jgi:MFS family permease
MQHPLGVFRVRNFRLYFAGQLVSSIGTWFQSLAQALLVVDLTGSGKALGLVTALQFCPVLLLAPYGGMLADRMRPRALLMTTARIAALLAIAAAAVAALDRITVPLICALALALGCLQAIDRPTSQAFLYELVGPEELTKAAGVHSITHSAGRMAGPALGGTAYMLFGSAVCFAINGASFLFVMLSLLLIRSDQLWPRQAGASEHGAQLRDGLRYALQRPELRTPLLVNGLIGCLAFNFMTTITAMVRFEFAGGAAALGAAHALNAAGAILGSLLVTSLSRPPSRALLATACAAMAFAIFVNALAPSLLWFLLWAPVFGFAIGAYQTSLLASVQRATEPAMLGRISGLLVFGSIGAIPVASLIGGWIIDAWSVRAAMALGGFGCLLGALVLARPLLQREIPRQAPGFR